MGEKSVGKVLHTHAGMFSMCEKDVLACLGFLCVDRIKSPIDLRFNSKIHCHVHSKETRFLYNEILTFLSTQNTSNKV